tara:strand:- start:312 stop:1019 length:708 start_codon:yes stop_codon:yes gene_type:complete
MDKQKNQIKQISEEDVIKYIKKNKNFLINNSELLNLLEFPSKWKSNKNVIDFNYQQSKKLQKQNNLLKSIIKEILKTEKENFVSQNNILKMSLQIANARNLNELIKTIKKNSKILLGVEFTNIISNNKYFIESDENKMIIYQNSNNIKIQKVLKNEDPIYLSKDESLNLIFYRQNSKLIKSNIILKLFISKKYFVLISFGSQNKNKFTKQQGYELISFLVKVCEGKIKSFLKNQK